MGPIIPSSKCGFMEKSMSIVNRVASSQVGSVNKWNDLSMVSGRAAKQEPMTLSQPTAASRDLDVLTL